MTDSATDRVRGQGDRAQGAVGGLRDAVSRNPAADRLKQEAQSLLVAKAQQLAFSAARKLGQTTGNLNDVAEGRAKPQSALMEGGKRLMEGESPVRAAVGTGFSQLKERVKGMFGGRGKGGSGGAKVINIIEDVDVGVPVRQAYDQWTQYHELARYSKGVRSVEKTDDLSSNWKAKIAFSERSWEANVTEQIPDQRIVWTSEGAKGTNKGVVTFHPLGDNLTKVLLVLEYYPKGLFEKTANLWRAQGRRTRLDLKHYRRYITMQGEASEGWRGEIRDGEVVREHEEAVEEEERQREAEEAEGQETAEAGEGEDTEDTEAREEEPEYAEAEEPRAEDEEVYEDEYEEDGEYEEPPEGEEPERGRGPDAEADTDEEAQPQERAAATSRTRR